MASHSQSQSSFVPTPTKHETPCAVQVQRKRPSHQISSSNSSSSSPDQNMITEKKTGLRSFGPGKRQRFIWSEELHKKFLLSIFEIGLEKAKPRIIFENLDGPEEMSTNQVKRNLAKYRGNLDRTNAMFMANVESAMSQARAEQEITPCRNGSNGKTTNCAFHAYPFPNGEEWEVPMFENPESKRSISESDEENDDK